MGGFVPFLQAAVPIAAPLIGNLLAGYQAKQGVESTNAANVAIADKQMAFQAQQSNTSYQRGMTDMKAAGLNPMLAYSQGGASSSPGAAIAMQNPKAPMAEAMKQGISSAIDAKRLQKEFAQADSQIALQGATKLREDAQTELNNNSARVAKLNAEILQSRKPSIAAQSKYEARKAKYDEKAAGYDAIANRVKSLFGIAGDAASIVKPKFNFNYKKGPYKGPQPKIKQHKGGYAADDIDF